jgi:hypothetical protein
MKTDIPASIFFENVVTPTVKRKYEEIAVFAAISARSRLSIAQSGFKSINMKRAILLIAALAVTLGAISQVEIQNVTRSVVTDGDVEMRASGTIANANIIADKNVVTLNGPTTTLVNGTIRCNQLVLNGTGLVLGKGARICCNTLTVGGGFTAITVSGNVEINCNQLAFPAGHGGISISGTGSKTKIEVYYGNAVAMPKVTNAPVNAPELVLLTRVFAGCN